MRLGLYVHISYVPWVIRHLHIAFGREDSMLDSVLLRGRYAANWYTEYKNICLKLTMSTYNIILKATCLDKKSKCTFTHTFPLCVRSEDSVAKPFPQILQWKGLFFNLSICDSWLRRCCWRFDNWMKARPQSMTWHLYGRSPI